MDKQIKVFISYKSEEQQYVEKVDKYLTSYGVETWYAPRNLDHSSVRPYDDEIADAIHGVDILVVLVSDASLSSKWVRIEVQRAEKLRKPVIPFVISEYNDNVVNGLLMRLESTHMIKAYPDMEVQLPALLDSIRKYMSNNYRTEDQDRISMDNIVTRKSHSGIDLAYDEGMALYEAGMKLDSIEFFLRSALRGNDAAKTKLCDLFYERNRDLSQIDDEIWNTIEAASDKGEAFADFLMHCKYYAMGNQNMLSFRYLQRSLERNTIPLALLRMGICYNWGMGVKQNHILGMHYYTKALDKGCIYAYSYIGQEYLWGNDKIEKSLDKAQEYILKGIAAGDTRCYSRVSSLYENEPDKIHELAQKMIDNGIKGGYKLMAEYWLWYAGEDKTDNEKAIEMAQKGLDNDESGVYGLLANAYYGNDNEKALRYAQIGAEQMDGLALYLLAYDSELEEDFATAWQTYMRRYELLGAGSEDLGRLYFDLEYRPDDFDLQDLKQILMTGAGNFDLNSLNYLLRLLVEERFGAKSKVSFNTLKEIPKVYDYLELGAQMGENRYKFYEGLFLIEGIDRHFNPRKGDEIIAGLAALEEDNYAELWVEYVIEYRKSYIFKHYDKASVLKEIRKVDLDDTKAWCSYLDWIIENHRYNIDNIVRLPILKRILDKEGETAYNSLTDTVKSYAQEEIEDLLYSNNRYGRNRGEILTEISKYFHLIFPKYDKKIIAQQGKAGTDSDIWTLFVTACSYLPNANYINSDELIEIYRPILDDGELMAKARETGNYELTGTSILKKTLDEFNEFYFKVCEEKSHNPKIVPAEMDFADTVPFVKPEKLREIVENRVQCLLEILPLFDDDIRARIIENIGNDYKMLDIAEELTGDQAAAMLLMAYVDNMLEIDVVFKAQTKVIEEWKKASGEEERETIVKELYDKFRNDVYNSSEENDNTVEESDDTAEEPESETDAEETSEKKNPFDSAEFDRLLDEFISKQLNDVEKELERLKNEDKDEDEDENE